MNYFTQINYTASTDGLDPDFWDVLAGTPSVVGDYLTIGSGQEVLARPIFKHGILTLDAKLPEPDGSVLGRIGLSDGLDTFIGFEWEEDGNLYAVIYNDSEEQIVVPSYGDDGEVLWDDSWHNNGASVDLNYQIIWEAGLIKFYIDGINVAVASDESYKTTIEGRVKQDPLLPSIPMSFYAEGLDAGFAEIKSVHIEGQHVPIQYSNLD